MAIDVPKSHMINFSYSKRIVLTQLLRLRWVIPTIIMDLNRPVALSSPQKSPKEVFSIAKDVYVWPSMPLGPIACVCL